MNKLTVGSLFAGIGGFDLGLERTGGLEVKWQVEIDRDCRAVLRRHWLGAAIYSDIEEIGGCELERVDLICAGVPCQDVSVAGQRAGLAGRRTGLFYDFARILREVRPAWFVFENVPGLLSSNGGRDFAEVLRVLMVECGYGVSWRVLNSQFFGVAQRRRRVFIVGSLGRPCPAEVLFESEGGSGHSTALFQEGQGVARSVGGSSVSSGYRHEPNGEDFVIASLQGGGHSGQPEPGSGIVIAATLSSGGHPESNAPGRRQEDDENLVAYALRRDPGGTGQGHNTTYAITENMRNRSQGPGNYVASDTLMSVRRLTPTECCRLQGFPDDWNDDQSDSARYRQLGNAVTVNVAEWIGKRILEAERMSVIEELEKREAPSSTAGLLE